MASVLASQGYDERALAIYEHLIDQNPTDTELLEEAAVVRDRLRGSSSAPRVDQVAAVCLDDKTLLVTWKLARDSIERAQTVLGVPGRLTSRVVLVSRDPNLLVRSDVVEHGPVEPTGQWLVESVPEGARCAAAVGLAHEGRFVSVAHADVVLTGE
jgi:hypothetical protein